MFRNREKVRLSLPPFNRVLALSLSIQSDLTVSCSQYGDLFGYVMLGRNMVVALGPKVRVVLAQCAHCFSALTIYDSLCRETT